MSYHATSWRSTLEILRPVLEHRRAVTESIAHTDTHCPIIMAVPIPTSTTGSDIVLIGIETSSIVEAPSCSKSRPNAISIAGCAMPAITDATNAIPTRNFS